MSDLIDKQATLSTILERYTNYERHGILQVTMNYVKQDLADLWEKLPSAENNVHDSENDAEKTGWIPVKFRPLTEEEQEQYPDYCYMADCLMPNEGDEILVTTTHGTVEKDEAGFDDGFYLDSGYDWQTDIVAWMPLPKPYKTESEGV